MSEPTIQHTESRHRYELSVDGEVVGICTYRDDGDRRVLVHTEVHDEFEGQGLATRLIEYALRDIRESGTRVVPECPMVAAYIDGHQEWADLVA